MQRFGNDLVLLEKIAAGGMAEVFRAKQIGYAGFEKTVALKRILPHYATSDDFKTMFRMEANLSACLQHNNIAQVFGNGEFEGYLYLIMEFLDGKNVRQLLGRADKEKFRIPLEISCFIVAETAKGLAHAHEYTDEKSGEPMKIVHRDMSPQNIMLTYDGSVKVVDFGIAKAAARSDMTRAGVLKGKFGYMSPEQAKGEKLDNRSDIFSLGIILWEMLTQRRLFSADDDMKTLQLVRQCKVMKPSQKNPMIPYELDRIVLKALSKNKSDRYSSSGEMYADIIRFINDRYTDFISTDLSKYMKRVYKKDRAEERKRREKQNLEAPAILNRVHKGKENRARQEHNFGSDMKDSDLTPMESHSEDKTRLSNANAYVQENEQKEAKQSLSNVEESLNVLEGGEVSSKEDFVPEVKDLKKVQNQTRKNFFTEQNAIDEERESAKKKKLFQMGAVAVVLLLLLASFFTGSPKDPVKKSELAQEKEASQLESLEKENFEEFDDLGASPKELAAEENLLEESGDKSPSGEKVSSPASSNEYDERLNSLDEVESTEAGDSLEEQGERDVYSETPSKIEGNTDVLGGLSITSVPKADKIYVNGLLLRDANQASLSTPLEKHPMPPGKYKVKLENTAFKVVKVIEVEVEAEKISKEDVVLESPEP